MAFQCTPITTYAGSKIDRFRVYGVGKHIADKLYFHRSYALDVFHVDYWNRLLDIFNSCNPGFEFSCIRWEPKDTTISFQEVPGFDRDREPAVGMYLTYFLHRDDGSFIYGGLMPYFIISGSG